MNNDKKENPKKNISQESSNKSIDFSVPKDNSGTADFYVTNTAAPPQNPAKSDSGSGGSSKQGK